MDVIKQGGSESLNQHSGLTVTTIQDTLGKLLSKYFMKDEIPTKFNTGWYIINMKYSTYKRNETHWVACFFKNRRIFYFDLIGVIAQIEILSHCHSLFL